MDDLDRAWNDMAAATSAAVEDFAAVDEVFLLFAAAVFALHQDTVRAYGIDMAKADDPGQAAAIDAAQPTPLGGFAARVGLAMDALLTIERANGELAANPPAGDNADLVRLELLMTRMRASAARLWLLTMQARAVGEGGAGLRLGVAGMWARLQTVPRDTLPERAPAFTGMFYENIRSDPPEFTAWPMSP
jgi:hypothetical protein